MITRITIIRGYKPKPKVGDEKIIKGVLCVRELKYVYDTRGNRLGLDCTGGRQRFIWVPKPITIPLTTPKEGDV